MANNPKKASRILALDIMRGITIAGMILVNNPGSWGHIYAPLAHAEWNGLTPTDLVFPFFMFIMGISTYISLRKFDFSFSWPTLAKILRRTVVIFAIGIGIAWLGLTLRGVYSEASLVEAMFNFDHIRILGVMPRLALCYGTASIIAITLNRKWLPGLIVALLGLYTAILLVGAGWEFSLENIISRVDHAILGADHMYADTIDGVKLKFDPEGLLSTIPSIAHTLIGFWCGMKMMSLHDNRDRALTLFIVGAILTFSGFLLNYGFPINKKIWSPTFVLTTCGLASSLLGLLIWVIDILGHKRWCRFFQVFGVNPLFLYVQGAVLSLLFGLVRLPLSSAEAGYTTVHGWYYNDILVPAVTDPTFASLLYALTFIMLNWAIGYILYVKKIYIKI